MLRLSPDKGAPIRFCETNPPFLRYKFLISYLLLDAYVVCRGFLQVGSFWKTNPPGGCFRGVFGGNVGSFLRTKPEYWLRHMDLPMTACRIRTRPYTWRSHPVGGVGGSDKARSCEHSRTFFSCALRKFPSKSCHRMCGGKTLWQGRFHESLRS